jgi:hypothetical protein
MRGTKTALGVAAAALGAALAVACIPDLPADAPRDAASSDAGAAEALAFDALSLCGNGIIDLDAGEQCDPAPNAGSPSYTGCTGECQMDCPDGHVGAANHHCYEFAASTQVLETAENTCSTLSAHVVTFVSSAEVSDVTQWLDTLDSGAFWVGLQGSASAPSQYTSLADVEPGWSTTCSGCFARVDDAGAPFPLFAADAGSPTASCVATGTAADATYARAACSAPAPFGVVCEHEPAGQLHVPCDGGVCIQVVATYGLKQYLYVSELVTATQARASCRALGGRLVVLRSREEREELWHELATLTSPPSSIWIGLGQSGVSTISDGGTANDVAWVWEDGMPVGTYPSPWGANEPKPDTTGAWAYESAAGTVDTTLAFADAHPASARTFVCEFDSGAN